MSLSFDHVVIAVKNLDNAVEQYKGLGFTVVRGGIHANRATYNAVVIFNDGTYLELLAGTGEMPIPNVIDFSGLLANVSTDPSLEEELVGFALRSSDLEEDQIRLKSLGFIVGEIIAGERLRQDGTLLQWKLALLDGFNGSTGFNAKFAPFFIQDVTDQRLRISSDPAITTHANGVQGIQSIEVGVHHQGGAKNQMAQLFELGDDRSAIEKGLKENRIALVAREAITTNIEVPTSFPTYLRIAQTNLAPKWLSEPEGSAKSQRSSKLLAALDRNGQVLVSVTLRNR